MNSRAGFPTYTLSRGASSANLSTSPCRIYKTILKSKLNGGEGEIRTHGALASLVFKTSSLNRSDTSPTLTTYKSIPIIRRFVKSFFHNYMFFYKNFPPSFCPYLFCTCKFRFITTYSKISCFGGAYLVISLGFFPFVFTVHSLFTVIRFKQRQHLPSPTNG